ncbi:MAG: VOC family protein [Candidatus Polarisedimenticolia bacterium]
MNDQVITSTLTPSLVYDDARRALRWLTDVLGFQVGSVYELPDGGVAHAELAWRTGIVFLSGRPPEDNPWSKAGPASIAVDRHYERAVAAGADIIRPVHDARTPAFPDGSHQFDVRDPEGNLWTIGTYRPRIP